MNTSKNKTMITISRVESEFVRNMDNMKTRTKKMPNI